MMQKVGDRDKDMVSVKDIAFCVNANPMSDRQQMVIEYEECDTAGRLQPASADRPKCDGGGDHAIRQPSTQARLEID